MIVEIDDFVLLGRACPEPLKDGRVTVCAAGWSAKLGFVRLYPTRPDSGWKKWDILQLPVERNPRDTRRESWKIAGSASEWENLNEKVQVVGHWDTKRRLDLIANLTDPCIQFLNARRYSLGIIRPLQIHKAYFANNPLHGQTHQLALPTLTDLDKWDVKRDFPEEPRLTYTCEDCQAKGGQHDQQLLEWGVYEWCRKNPQNIEQVWDNLGLRDSKSQHYFLVGNQSSHRSSFMVIDVLRLPLGEPTLPLFPNMYVKRAPDALVPDAD
jgi:hypothetical protein